MKRSASRTCRYLPSGATQRQRVSTIRFVQSSGVDAVQTSTRPSMTDASGVCCFHEEHAGTRTSRREKLSEVFRHGPKVVSDENAAL